MKYKAIIFDFDGVIMDTEIIEHRALKKIVKEYDKEPVLFSNGLLQKVGGGSGYYKEFKERHSINEEDDVLREKKRSYFDRIVLEEELQPYEGLLDLIERLLEANYKIALASNRHEESVNLVLEKLKLKIFFNVIIGPAENRKHKPAADIYLHAAKELNLKPSECVALEDTDVGIVSAKQAGMKVIAIPNDYTKDRDFSQADKIVKNFSEITISLLDNL